MKEANDSLDVLIRTAIGVLCGGAFLLIVLILSGTGIDETSARTIGTAIALAFFSLTGVAGSNLNRRRPDLGLFGYLTIVISVAAFLAMVATLWTDSFSGGNGWRPAVYAGILAFACGHASVLLSGAREDHSDGVRLIRAGTLLALAALVALTFAEISSKGPDGELKAIAVMAVLYVLGTIVLGLLRRAAPRQAAIAPRSPAAGAAGVRLDHLVIAVSDRAASTAFYRDVLGAELVTLPEGRFAFRIGDQQLNVHDPATAAQPLAREPVRPGGSDLCFVWPGSAESAVAHLQRLGIELVDGPVVRHGAAGAGSSVYVRDPDGSLIELIAYP